MSFYLVDVSPDDPPQTLQARCLTYFEPEALDTLPLMPVNQALLEAVKRQLIRL